MKDGSRPDDRRDCVRIRDGRMTGRIAAGSEAAG